eukprot:15435614-Alexandrium_andersonii.AAC.1
MCLAPTAGSGSGPRRPAALGSAPARRTRPVALARLAEGPLERGAAIVAHEMPVSYTHLRAHETSAHL